jgi:hypothetical protein
VQPPGKLAGLRAIEATLSQEFKKHRACCWRQQPATSDAAAAPWYYHSLAQTVGLCCKLAPPAWESMQELCRDVPAIKAAGNDKTGKCQPAVQPPAKPAGRQPDAELVNKHGGHGGN